MAKITTTCLFLFLTVLSDSAAPPPTIKCTSSGTKNCTITNSYGSFPDRSTCRAASAVFPTTEAELISAVAAATQRRLKMKVATRYYHSIPKLACPGGDLGLSISTERLEKVLGVDAEAGTIIVESGITLRALIAAAAKAGLALPNGPYWWGVTVGGMLGTGAHGSSLWGIGSAVHDYVVGVTIVSPGGAEDGYVKVRRLVAGRDDRELNAVKVSLGALGAVSQVTFKLQPMFKRSITYVTKNDSDLGDQVVNFGRKHEFADLTWYPSQGKVLYRIDDRVPVNTSGDGLYDSINFQPTLPLDQEIIRSAEELQELLEDDNGKCNDAVLDTSTFAASYNGLTNNGLIFTGYPVIGYQNRIQSSGACLDIKNDTKVCSWDPSVKSHFFHQTAFSVALPVAKSFIEDFQALVRLNKRAFCGTELYTGILIRYETASTAYLGKEVEAISLDITYYRSHDPLEPRLHEDVFEEVEQMAYFKYGALPHWGKNRNVAFVGAISKYKNSNMFLKVKDEFDPLGLFSSEWSDQVLGLKTGLEIMKEGCALEGLCICKENIHCSPSNGYLCSPGKIYKEARVCRRDTGSTVSSI